MKPRPFYRLERDSYFVSLDEFKEAVMRKGLSYARSHGCKAWVVDSSRAKGAFSKEIQDYIASDVFKELAKSGIKYFVTVRSDSAITNMPSSG